MSANSSNNVIPARAFVIQYLIPRINKAAENDFCTMVFSNYINLSLATYWFSKMIDPNYIKNSCNRSGHVWDLLQINGNLMLPSHSDIAKELVDLGYEIIDQDDKFLIINWSLKMALENAKLMPDTPPVTATIDQNFLKAVAQSALNNRSNIETIFHHIGSNQVQALNAPSDKFRNFKIDLNLLIDCRLQYGYTITYRPGQSTQQYMVIITMPLAVAHQIINN